MQKVTYSDRDAPHDLQNHETMDPSKKKKMNAIISLSLVKWAYITGVY